MNIDPNANANAPFRMCEIICHPPIRLDSVMAKLVVDSAAAHPNDQPQACQEESLSEIFQVIEERHLPG
jgi:hypothetical protein